MNIAAIDFETANGSMASVCSVGISTLSDGVIDENAYYSLIRPEENVSEFNYWNIKIHGIHPEDVENAPDFRRVYEEMFPLLDGNLLCAHNARFDMSCIRETCKNCDLEVPKFYYFDTVELSRKMCPELPHHRLNDMCDYLHIELNHHNAASDAFGCLMIVEKAMEISGIYDIEELLKKANVKIRQMK